MANTGYYLQHKYTPSAVISLKEGENRIGRAPDNDIVLEDAENCLSRYHARLSISNGNCTIMDLSSNGVLLGGSRIEKSREYHIAPNTEVALLGPNFSSEGPEESSGKPIFTYIYIKKVQKPQLPQTEKRSLISKLFSR